jgi:hypothetical protein
MCKFRKTLFTLWNDGPEPGPAVRQAPHDTRQHNVGISHSVARSFFVAARAASRTGPSETKAPCKQYLMRHGIRGPSIFRPTFYTRPTITRPRLRCRVEMHMLCICMRVCAINFRRTTDAIGRADRVRELSRTLEPNFQRRERKFIHAAAKQIVTITTSLSALMCLPHRGVFRLVNSATRV